MKGIVSSIRRYPVKGLGGEVLERAELAPGRMIAGDRAFAVTTATSGFDPDAPTWAPKRNFLQMCHDPALTAVHATWHDAERRLRLTGGFGQGPSAEGNPGLADDRQRLEVFLDTALSGDDRRRGRGRLVEAADFSFADTERPFVSLVSASTVAALSAAAERPLDPVRFRANIVFEGAPAWAELGWIGHDLTLGTAKLRVVEPIGRCYATTLDPTNGVSDVNLPDLLRKVFGHNKCGVYAEVIGAGACAPGDRLIVHP